MKLSCSLLLSVLFCALPSTAQSSVERLRQLITSNTLGQEGKAPFHLKLEFQLYDMAGKPTEKGVVEEWWASPKLHQIVITAPSLNDVLLSKTKPVSEQPLREEVLVNELLATVIAPIPNYQTFAGLTAHEVKWTANSTQLRCIVVDSINPKAPTFYSPTYCTEPATNVLRLRTDAFGDTASRNSVGTFHDTDVALDLQLAKQGTLAITGHVVAMNSFDPATSIVDLNEPDLDRVNQEQIPETFTAGRNITHVLPVYPSVAKAAHVQGTVNLHGVISKVGTITQLIVIASRSPMLNEAAEDAVRQWTYVPYLHDGKPVEVETTIRVSFAFDGH